MAWFDRELQIDDVLKAGVRPAKLASYRTTARALPAYRFVDLHRAVHALASETDGPRVIDSENAEDLNSLLHAKRQAWNSRKLTQSSRSAWPTGTGTEEFYVSDRTFVFQPRGEPDKVIVRVRYFPMAENAILEVGATKPERAVALMDAILRKADEDSIYRGSVIELAFESGTKDEYGDVEKPERLRILFKRLDPVTDEDLVVEDEIRDVLLRNVVDLHARREVLKKHGVPIRRGVLLYGPPGTGKTFACRYLCGKLEGVTRILVAGSALLQVGQIFTLARLFQPSVVFLEDVDLVFMTREVNLYSSVLGELLDQMDGLRPHEDVGFVMTTNAIDRMEAAVRDRPGRISQCIHLGPPNPDLRRRYLARYLEPYDTGEVELDRLVRDSDGATQAFLKEWVHRAVQVGSERVDLSAERVPLRTEDFTTALGEMRRYTDASTAKIVGFHARR